MRGTQRLTFVLGLVFRVGEVKKAEEGVGGGRWLVLLFLFG
jgi:hypothetical protein